MALGQETLTHSRRPRLQNSSSGHAKPLIATRVARFLPVLDKSDSALNDKGRAGFVMANSAGDARGSELDIRKKMLEDRAVDVMVSVGPNFFYTVTLPCTLWFLDRGKKKSGRKDKVLFIDARHIFHQIDRAHRDWTPDQIEFISNIVRLYRANAVENDAESNRLIKENFQKGNTATFLDCAKSPRLPKLKRKGGVS